MAARIPKEWLWHVDSAPWADARHKDEEGGRMTEEGVSDSSTQGMLCKILSDCFDFGLGGSSVDCSVRGNMCR